MHLKNTIFILFLFPTVLFSQEIRESKRQKIERLEMENALLKQRDEIQQAKIDELISEFEQFSESGKTNATLVFELRKENEKLRDIMKTYVKQIDQLNTELMQIQRKLDECEH